MKIEFSDPQTGRRLLIETSEKEMVAVAKTPLGTALARLVSFIVQLLQ